MQFGRPMSVPMMKMPPPSVIDNRLGSSRNPNKVYTCKFKCTCTYMNLYKFINLCMQCPFYYIYTYKEWDNSLMKNTVGEFGRHMHSQPSCHHFCFLVFGCLSFPFVSCANRTIKFCTPQCSPVHHPTTFPPALNQREHNSVNRTD